jgi:hypothetical protein
MIHVAHQLRGQRLAEKLKIAGESYNSTALGVFYTDIHYWL